MVTNENLIRSLVNLWMIVISMNLITGLLLENPSKLGNSKVPENAKVKADTLVIKFAKKSTTELNSGSPCLSIIKLLTKPIFKNSFANRSFTLILKYFS